MRYHRWLAVLIALALVVAGCGYVRMLRPSVLKPLNPRVVELVNELPELDHANKAVVGQLFAKGGLAHAVVGPDGVMPTRVRVPPLQYLWEPAVIVMPHGRPLEIEFDNMPNNGSRVHLERASRPSSTPRRGG
jgi:hypothetical protein